MQSLGEKIGIFALALTMLSLGTSPHPLILILCYLIHEAGHLLFSKLVGAEMKCFRIRTLRLCLSYDCSSLTYPRELLVDFGGILFNLASALIVALIPVFFGGVSDFFIICNVSLALMNLYPVSVLDGGNIVKTVLLMITTEERAQEIFRIVSFVFALVLWLVAVYLQLVFSANISLLLISVFLLVELCFAHA